MMNDSQQQRALREEQAVMAAAELKVQEAVRALNKQKTDLEARVRVAEQKAIDHAVRAREAELRAESAAESAATKIARHAVRAREAEMKYEAVQRDLETARAYQTGKVNARNDTASSHGATSGEVCTLFHSMQPKDLTSSGKTSHRFLHLKELMGVTLSRMSKRP